MRITIGRLETCVAALLLGTLATPALAVDGVVLIDQNRAAAGGVTPGDTAGFPVTISVPGSYRLAGDLTVGDSNTSAIVITAPNVSLDLNGFSILGPVSCGRSGGAVACTPGGSGIGVSAPAASNVTITNGTIRGFAQPAILMTAGGALPSRVEKTSAASNGSTGIAVDDGVLANNIATLNAIHGLGLNHGYAVGNYSTNNGASGLFIGSGGYMGNVFTLNGFNTTGTPVFSASAVNMGQNVCGGSSCFGGQF